MARKKKKAEEAPPEDAPIEPGAAASAEVSDDGPLPEDLDEEGAETNAGADDEDEEETPPPGVPDRSPHVSPETPPPPPPAPAPKAPVDPRAELRKRLGEPTPDFPGAIVDPQTGRCENAPPGWDPRRRPPQKP